MGGCRRGVSGCRRGVGGSTIDKLYNHKVEAGRIY